MHPVVAGWPGGFQPPEPPAFCRFAFSYQHPDLAASTMLQLASLMGENPNLAKSAVDAEAMDQAIVAGALLQAIPARLTSYQISCIGAIAEQMQGWVG